MEDDILLFCKEGQEELFTVRGKIGGRVMLF